MKRPTFQTMEKKRPDVLLLVDKENTLANHLLAVFPKDIPTVVVSSEKPTIFESRPVGYVPFKSTMPSIPDTYYSHIFVVYTGEKTVLSLIPQFLDKARVDNAKIFFVMDLFLADVSFVQELIHSYRNAHAIILGDVFGKDVMVDPTKTLYRFFEEAKTTGNLLVRGDGLTHIYPVEFSDAMKEIMRAGFSQKLPKIGYIFPKHAPTELSLARMLQSINPFLRIDFVDETLHAAEGMENTQKHMNLSSSAEYLLQTNYPLLRKIKESTLLSEKHIAPKKEDPGKPQIAPAIAAVLATPPKKEKKPVSMKKLSLHVPIKKRSWPLSPLAGITYLFVVFFLPLIVTGVFSLSGLIGLALAKQSLFKGDFQKAYRQASNSYTLFSLAKTTNLVVSKQAAFVGLSDQADLLSKYINLGSDGSYAFANVVDSAGTFLAIFKKQVADPRGSFLDASNNLKKAITVYDKVLVEHSIPGFSDIDTLVGIIGNTIDSYPAILGFDRAKTYLLLFQNNMELRPTGGFIGSYGMLTLHNGSISNFTIHDVYDADGQLTAHVEPVYPVRRYMKIVHQYLRDSNFDPDFPTAASTAANMLNLETQQNIDGVIAVDVSFVKMLVGALGPLRVPDYNETVTENNFYMLTQSHVEKNFFPGSTQKKDFLRSLLLAMQLKLSDGSIPYLALGKTIASAISQKHLLFAFPDKSIQHLFSVNNMSGSLMDSRSIGVNQYNDFLAIIDANIGANKANAFVYRKVEQKTRVSENGRIFNDVTIRYKNSSEQWPGGDYKNYLRIIVPKGAILQSVAFDGEKQHIYNAITDYLLYERPDFTPPPGLEVETSEEMGKTTFAFLVTIPKGAFKTITVSYISSVLINNTAQLASYDHWYYKQPGTDAYPYSFVFSYPATYKPLVAKGVTTLDTSLVFEQIINTDQFFHIDLSHQQ